jgi:hypothetical protein
MPLRRLRTAVRVERARHDFSRSPRAYVEHVVFYTLKNCSILIWAASMT